METAFTYSPLDKIFEKQIKTIEQLKALEDQGKQLDKSNNEKESPAVLKQKK